MVIGAVAKELFKYAARYYRFEGKAFDRLYTGFPASKTIGRGVRHGLTAGSIAGSFISNPVEDIINGFPQKRNGIPSDKFQKKRGGYQRGPRSTYQYGSRYNRKRCRPSRPRYS